MPPRIVTASTHVRDRFNARALRIGRSRDRDRPFKRRVVLKNMPRETKAPAECGNADCRVSLAAMHQQQARNSRQNGAFFASGEIENNCSISMR